MAFLLTLTGIASSPRGIATLRQSSTSSNSERIRSCTTSLPRVCACRRVKDREETVIRVSDPINYSEVLPFFPSPVIRVPSPSPPSPSLEQQQLQRDGGDDKQDYYVNMGYAIRTLREEFPDIFYKEPNFDIYRDDIVFKDPLNTFIGIENYKRIFWALRFSGQILFKALWIDIVSVWQPVDSVIMIRWVLHGIPRVPWESRGRFDGISVYKLDRQGKIYEHRVDNVARNPPTKFRVLAVEELVRALGGQSTPKPTYFETYLLISISSMPSLLGFSYLGCYLETLALQCTAKGCEKFRDPKKPCKSCPAL